MKLAQILALHPQGADAATQREAIGRAEALRGELRARAVELDSARAGGLLTLEEKAILQAEADAATARLAADRIDALLPVMHADLHGALGHEALAELRAEAAKVLQLIAEESRWNERCVSALAALHSNVAAAYTRQEVRDAGPLNIEASNILGRGNLFGQAGRAAIVNAAKSFLPTAIVEPRHEGVLVAVVSLHAVILEPHPSGLHGIAPLLLNEGERLRLPMGEAEALHQRGFVTSPTTGEAPPRTPPPVPFVSRTTVTFGSGRPQNLEGHNHIGMSEYREAARQAQEKVDAEEAAKRAEEARRFPNGQVGDREGRLPVRVEGGWPRGPDVGW